MKYFAFKKVLETTILIDNFLIAYIITLGFQIIIYLYVYVCMYLHMDYMSA